VTATDPVDTGARSKAINKAAVALQEAWDTGRQCPPVRQWLPEGDIDAAYAVQDVRTQARLAMGHRLVGRKIGLTAPAVQKQLGVDQPDYGMLFDDMDVPQGAVIPWGAVQQPKVEAEIAFLLRHDLDSERLTSADLLDAIEYVVGAIEIVGSRIENWHIGIVDTVSDNASAALFTLGHQVRQLREIDVIAASMSLYRGEEQVSSGRGADCMGSPISAALWLAKRMVQVRSPLRRGDVVLSGALGPMVSVSPGADFVAHIEGLGSVRVAFGADQCNAR